MKLVLVRARGNNSAFRSGDHFSYPVNLLSLATYLKRKMPELQVEVYDEELAELDYEAILNDCDYFGVDSYFGSHERSLVILAKVKQLDPRVQTLIGGPNTVHLGEQIIRNNPQVDFVLNGICAEDSLEALLEGKDKASIPNLYFRENGKIKFSFSQTRFSLDDYHYDMEAIRNIDPDALNRRFPVRSILGCIKAVSSKRCVFCALPYKGVRVKTPENFWKQVKLLHDKYGVTKFLEAGDSIFVGNYPEILLLARPEGLEDVRFRVYAEPQDLTEKNALTLKRLGVDLVFMGVESGSDKMLQKMGKRHTTQDIEMAFENCQKVGLEVGFPILLGLPGESPKTLEETFSFTRRIFEKYHEIVTYRLITVVVPVAGSELFRLCQENANIRNAYNLNGRNLLRDDNIDYELLQKLMVKEFCQISMAELEEMKVRLESLHPIQDTYSWKTN